MAERAGPFFLVVLVISAMTLLGAATCFAKRPLHSVGYTTASPEIDGQLHDKPWQYALEMGGFSVARMQTPAEAQTRLYFAYDDSHLYVAVRAEQLDMDNLSGASRADGDVTIWQNDSVELFIDRNGDRESYYHFIVNRVGTLYDAWRKQGEGADATWTSEAKVAAGADDDGWMLELAIPLENLGGPVEAGEAWLFNAVRNNPSDNEFSSWVPLSEHHWHTPEHFASLKYVDESPGFRLITMEASLDGVEFSYELKDTRAQDYELQFAIEPVVHKRKNISSNAGDTTTVTVGYNPADWHTTLTSGVVITLGRNGTTLYRWVQRHASSFVQIERYDRLTAEVLHLSRDWTSTDIPLNTRHNFPNAGPPADTVDTPWSIMVEAPEGIVADNAERVGQATRDRVQLDVYEIKLNRLHGQPVWHKFGLKTTLPADEMRTVYYYARWEGGQQEPRALEVRTVEVGHATPPKRFITGVYDFYLNNMRQIETVRALQRAGVNTMSVLRNRDPEVYDAVRELGMFMREGDYFWPGDGHHGVGGWGQWTENDHDARSVDRAGYPAVGGRGYQLCPSYRGRELYKALAKTRQRVLESGVNWFAFDMEGYVHPTGEQGCFCDRCLKLFEEFRDERYSDLSNTDPRTFAADFESHRAYHEAWVAFKDYQWAGLFKEMKRELEDVVGQTSPKSDVVFSEWSFSAPWDVESVDNRYRGWEFVRTFDWFEVSAYSSVQRFIDAQNDREDNIAKHGPDDINVDWIITPSPRRLQDRFYATDLMDHPNELKYKIFEAAAFGAHGIYLWYWPMVDADTMRQFAEAIDTIGKVEDVIIDGSRIADMTSSNEVVGVRGVEVGREAVLVVAEYHSSDAVSTTVSYPVNELSEVRDLETGEVIAWITPEQAEFEISLPEDHRARLIHIVVPGEAYDPGVNVEFHGPPENVDPDAVLEREWATEAMRLELMPRHKALPQAMAEGDLVDGVSTSHGGEINGEWHDELWHYWSATDGAGPSDWVFEPMVFDRSAWGGEGGFQTVINDEQSGNPLALRQGIFASGARLADAAAISIRNPFDYLVRLDIEGLVRISSIWESKVNHLFYRTSINGTKLVKDSNQELATSAYGKTGSGKDRMYFRLWDSVTLPPGAHFYFAGSISGTEQSRGYIIWDDDRWGDAYRPRLFMRPEVDNE